MMNLKIMDMTMEDNGYSNNFCNELCYNCMYNYDHVNNNNNYHYHYHIVTILSYYYIILLFYYYHIILEYHQTKECVERYVDCENKCIGKGQHHIFV